MSQRVLLVASTGGHLEQLHQLRPSLLAQDEIPVWVTFDAPQSRSLLAEERDVLYLRRVGSRGYLDLARVLWPALRLMRRQKATRVVSTGAGIALAFLPFAWTVRARAVYIESAARTAGPSLTGKILSLLPWVGLRTQYQGWAGRRWRYVHSVFDGYVPVTNSQEATPIRRVVVTLGTQEGYPFVSLVRRVRHVVPEEVEVLWQVGPGFPVSERPPGARDMVPRAELAEWITSADAVVTHAGVGSALTLLSLGKMPVLVPRSAEGGEHIDDHQKLIATELAQRGLAISVSADDLRWEDIRRSGSTAVRRADSQTSAERRDRPSS